MSSERLFAGKPEILGGLSNEEELVLLCPKEFKKDNAWSHYASLLFFYGANISMWKWKTSELQMRNHQALCLNGLLGTFSIGHNEKISVAGWMLSHMLHEVPEHIPKKEVEVN